MTPEIYVPLAGGAIAAFCTWLIFAIALASVRSAGLDLGSPFGWPVWTGLGVGVVVGLFLYFLDFALQDIG